MRIFGVEVRRILLARRNQIFLIFGLLISVIVPVYSIHGIGYRYMDPDGTYVFLNGLDAVKYRRELYAAYDGEITAGKLEQALSQYQEGVAEAGGLPVNDEAFPQDIYQEKIAPVRELLYLAEKVFTDPDGRSSPWTSLAEVPPAEMSEFYQRVEDYRYDIIDAQYGGNPGVRDAVEKMSAEIERPFQTYGEFSFDSLELFELTVFLLVILCSAIAAPSFSENYESGSDHIIRCAKYGRAPFGVSKICALSVVLTVYYLLCSWIHIGILNAAFGTESLATSVQALREITSLAPVNAGQLEMILIFGGLLTMLSTAGMVLFISAKMDTAFASVLFSLILVMVPIVMYFVFGVSWLSFLWPSSGVGLTNDLLRQLNGMNFLMLGDTAVWTPDVICFFAAAELAAFVILSVCSYCKHQAA